jgi:hypothetical protein
MFAATMKFSILLTDFITNISYISNNNSVMRITCVIYHILVCFKSWCEAPQGWHNIETFQSNIRMYVYIRGVFVGFMNEELNGSNEFTL